MKNFYFKNKLNIAKKQSGIVLLEALIAILIFSFGLLGLVGLQAVTSQNSANAEERSRASMLANDIVSQMWVRQSLTSADVNTDIAAWQTHVADISKSGLPNSAGVVSVNGNLATITITWKSPSKTTTDNSNRYVTNVAMPTP